MQQQQRPRGVLGLSAHYLKLKWAGLGPAKRIMVFGAILAGGIALAMSARCMLSSSSSCSASGGCPTSYSSPYSSPCNSR